MATVWMWYIVVCASRDYHQYYEATIKVKARSVREARKKGCEYAREHFFGDSVEIPCVVPYGDKEPVLHHRKYHEYEPDEDIIE